MADIVNFFTGGGGGGGGVGGIWSSIVGPLEDLFEKKFQEFGNEIVKEVRGPILNSLKNFGHELLDKLDNLGHEIMDKFLMKAAEFFTCVGYAIYDDMLDAWYTYISVELCGWILYSIFIYPHCIIWWIIFLLLFIIKCIMFIISIFTNNIFNPTDILNMVKSFDYGVDFGGGPIYFTRFGPEVTCKCFTTGNFKYLFLAAIPFLSTLRFFDIFIKCGFSTATGNDTNPIPYIFDDFILQLPHWEKDEQFNIVEGNYYDCGGLGLQGCDMNSDPEKPKDLDENKIKQNSKKASITFGSSAMT